MHPLITESLNENIPIEEVHKQIDKAIEQYRENILALKSQRNRYAPFSRLPPEIICKIFTFAKIPGLDYYWRGQPMKLIKLTHVTRHWRSVALNSPSLWTDLPVGNGNPLLIEELLRRSKDASLAINCDLATIHHMRPGLDLALQHSARAKEMLFRNVRSSMWNDLQKHLSQPTPRLEYLTLEGSTPVPLFNYGIGTATKPERISITGRVLCETGRLHHLELINCNVDWTSHSHIFHSLTHLKLHNIPNSLRPNGKQFVDILKGMPDLEFLDLKDVLPVQTGEKMPWTSDRIHFRSLRTLKMQSTNNELEPFFSCVTFPPTTAVNIVCSASDTSANTPISTNHFSSFMLSLGRSYSDCSSARTFQTIILPKIGLDFELHLRLFTDELANDWSLYTTSTPSLELQFIWKSVTQDVENLLHDIFDGAIHLHHVKRVYLAGLEHELAGNAIANTFGMLPCVRSVLAANGAAASFFNALKLRLHDDKMEPITANPTPSLYFPRLSSISLLDVNFDGLDGLTIENLQDCLIQRCEYGAGIEKLTLSDCIRLGEEDVDLLSEIVVDVDWDGQEVFTEDEEEDEDEDEEEDDYTDPYNEFADEDYDGSLYGDGDPLDFW